MVDGPSASPPPSGIAGEIAFEIDGESVAARAGQTIAMALFAAGRPQIRQSARYAAPRGVFCNMGVCYDCLVYLDGRAVRSCMVPVEDGMRLTSWGPQQEATP